MGTKQAPPGHLSDYSKRLWSALVADWVLDTAQLAILRVALEARDRLEQAREILSREGLTIEGASGMTRAHPALKVEKEARAGFLLSLRTIGFHLEPPAENGGRE
jgi:P27 family predicted phage terminase small subunit